MKSIYFLETPYDPAINKDLASQYVEHLMRTYPGFADTLIYLVNHLKNFTIKNGEIDNLEKEPNGDLVYKIYTTDLVSGQLKPTIIIKKLREFDHTYELRINQHYFKFRILFYFNFIPNISKEEFFVLSYGFSKTDGAYDNTDDFAKSNDYIKNDILSNNTKSTNDNWLGGVWNEF